jgi:hypothetical protein
MVVILASGQQIQVTGQFQSDSVKIGQPLPYILTATYPRDVTLVFPDSTFAFTPFEIQHKEFFPTHTHGRISIDSVVYYLATYEIDKVQRLQLPVFIVHPSDCTAVYAKPDSVFLQELIQQVPDSVSAQQLPLKTNTAYHRVKWLFNYPLVMIIAASILVLILISWIIFGKRIRRYFRLRRLRKNHEYFINRFDRASSDLGQGYSKSKAEAAMIMWKKYMEELEEQPFTKYTTKELRTIVSDGELIETLRIIDRMIYSDSNGKNTSSFEKLKQYAEQEFQKKREEVING